MRSAISFTGSLTGSVQAASQAALQAALNYAGKTQAALNIYIKGMNRYPLLIILTLPAFSLHNLTLPVTLPETLTVTLPERCLGSCLNVGKPLRSLTIVAHLPLPVPSVPFPFPTELSTQIHLPLELDKHSLRERLMRNMITMKRAARITEKPAYWCIFEIILFQQICSGKIWTSMKQAAVSILADQVALYCWLVQTTSSILPRPGCAKKKPRPPDSMLLSCVGMACEICSNSLAREAEAEH